MTGSPAFVRSGKVLQKPVTPKFKKSVTIHPLNSLKIKVLQKESTQKSSDKSCVIEKFSSRSLIYCYSHQ
jgi:hypothetical protein